MELRCDSRILHGVLDDSVIEVKCRSRRCGHAAGVVVIHRFDARTGELLDTLRFRDTPTNKKGETDVSGREPAALRSA